MKSLRYSIVLLLSMVLYSCSTISEYPHGDGVDPTLVRVKLKFNLDFNMGNIDNLRTYSTDKGRANEAYDLRYIIDLYEYKDVDPMNITNRKYRIIKSVDKLNSEEGISITEEALIALNKYNVVVWVDFVKKGSLNDYNYNTKTLSSVEIIERDGQYSGYDVSKEAFCGNAEMDLTPFRDRYFVETELTIQVERPFACYNIVTTDYKKYVSSYESNSVERYVEKPSSTQVVYNCYLPMAFNVFTMQPDKLELGVNKHYNYAIQLLGNEEEALLASDFVFVAPNIPYVKLNFEILNSKGANLNTIKDLRVNLLRNKTTVVKGEFLTVNIDKGGISIDDSFEDEIVVEIK